MARQLRIALGLTAAAAVVGSALAATPASAARFKCPHVGGNFVFGQEANINSLDQPASNTISTRNVAMNIFEALMTRDENNNPITSLAASYTESPDRLTYTFKLRKDVHFHNGKLMTSADVLASFNRYNKIGLDRGMFANVKSWDTPDADTFVIHMKQPQPTFITALSSFSVPVIIVPAELADAAPMQLKIVGTGPWKLAEFVPGGHVTLKRFADYAANTKYETRTGFGGYKQACFDTVTIRIVTEPGARVAGLQTGELQGVEDLPTKSLPALKKDKNIKILPLKNWWIQIALPNTSAVPTNNLDFRKAVQAVLNMKDIMEAATDGNYSLNVGFQYPNQPTYTDAGKDTYNLHNPKLAKEYLAKSGYKGEPVVLLTDKDYPPMYNAAVVMAAQMQSIGINAQLKVLDWPSSVQMQQNTTKGWNFFFTGYGTQPALGPLATMRFFTPGNNVYKSPVPGGDPDLAKYWKQMNEDPSAKGRQQAFADMQKTILEKVYAVPFGSLTKVQGVRANVEGFKPFRIPRMSNVWFSK